MTCVCVHTQGGIQLTVTVKDEDLVFGDDLVDVITVPIKMDAVWQCHFGETDQVYQGKNAKLTLSYTVTAQCYSEYYGLDCHIYCQSSHPRYRCGDCGEKICRDHFAGLNCMECETNYYGRDCTKFCIGHDNWLGHYHCTEEGEKDCFQHYQPPDCTECEPHYYGWSCSKFCHPRNDEQGHYRCSSSGDRVCLENYANLPDCLQCKANHYGPDCSCVPQRSNSKGHYDCSEDGTKLCLPDYYPPEVCTTYCLPKDNKKGHYSCSEQGQKVCLEGYTDPQADCTTGKCVNILVFKGHAIGQC